MAVNYEFFLGGRDLEIVTLRQLLDSAEVTRVHDRELAWNEAKTSAYKNEIAACLAANRVAVLVELMDDCGLAEEVVAGRVILVDHHGDLAGKGVPTALEQVFQLLELPEEQWTREWELVSANDRGHVRGMLAVNATPEELQRVRAADRKAQGITPEEEVAGRAAADARKHYADGRLTVVHLPHSRSATVTDALDADLDGPGFENLLILSPSETLFFGEGHVIERLKSRYAGGWWGGELPERGFWGRAEAIDGQEIICMLEECVSTQPANKIEVKAFRHIVMLPLLLRSAPTRKSDDKGLLQPWVDEFTKEQGPTNQRLWKEEYSGNSCGVHSRFSYEQIVYFHPFVRDFLFGDGSDDLQNRTTRILTRDDIKGLNVELGESPSVGVRLHFDVRRVELYLCKPRVAILVVEVELPQDEEGRPESRVLLSELQDFTDQFRRLYPPFWLDEKSQELHATSAGLCLRQLDWLDAAGQAIDIAPHLPENDLDAKLRTLGGEKQHFDDFARVGAEPPLFAHWQWLFGKTIRPAQKQAHIQGVKDGNTSDLFVQQLLDERMPVMSFFAVDDPSEVSEGDHDRLAFVDASGPDDYPYEKEFLAERRSRYTYNRFAQYGTRCFCSGYGFSMIGQTGQPGIVGSDFYETTSIEHFSGHYFCVGLIAHFQRAALLYFADELASSVKDLAGESLGDELSSPKFRAGVETIQHRFLKFRSRAFFPEVTSQLQGRELFELWFNVLETQALFDLVDSTSERMATVLAERESRQLTRVATRSIPWGIGLAFASLLVSMMNSIWLILGLVPVLSLLVVAITHCLLEGSEEKPWWMRILHCPARVWSQITRTRTYR